MCQTHSILKEMCSSEVATRSYKKGSIKKAVLKNFSTFIAKHLSWSLLLIKLQVFRPETLLKRLQHRCFPVNIAKFLRKPILQSICEDCFWFVKIVNQKTTAHTVNTFVHNKVCLVIFQHIDERVKRAFIWKRYCNFISQTYLVDELGEH